MPIPLALFLNIGYICGAVSLLVAIYALVKLLRKKSSDRTFELAMLISVPCLTFLIGVSTFLMFYL